jgi:glutamate-1-semialdehyde 2,1-aminomutase
MLSGLDDVIARHRLPCHTVGLAAKGCVVFSRERLYEYRDYATCVDEELSTLSWLYHMNRGIFMTPGVDEQWTLSVAHRAEDLGRYVDAFEAFARDLGA